MTPRTTHAEGLLSGTVRCLVRTVFLTECQPRTTNPSQPAPNNSSPPSTQPPAAQPSQQAGQPTSNSPAAYQEAAPLADVEKIDVELPEIVQPIPELRPMPTTVSANRVQQSEYAAYFNKHSPYAVLGAQQVAGTTAIAPSSDGWKLLGISWYWWVAVIAVVAIGLFTVRRLFLRKLSVLLNK